MDEQELEQSNHPEACIELGIGPVALDDDMIGLRTIHVTELQLVEFMMRIHDLLPEVHAARSRVWEAAEKRRQKFDEHMAEVRRDVSANMPENDLLRRVLDGLRAKRESMTA